MPGRPRRERKGPGPVWRTPPFSVLAGCLGPRTAVKMDQEVEFQGEIVDERMGDGEVAVLPVTRRSAAPRADAEDRPSGRERGEVEFDRDRRSGDPHREAAGETSAWRVGPSRCGAGSRAREKPRMARWVAAKRRARTGRGPGWCRRRVRRTDDGHSK
jgi:hypothetical protein